MLFSYGLLSFENWACVASGVCVCPAAKAPFWTVTNSQWYNPVSIWYSLLLMSVSSSWVSHLSPSLLLSSSLLLLLPVLKTLIKRQRSKSLDNCLDLSIRWYKPKPFHKYWLDCCPNDLSDKQTVLWKLVKKEF